MRSVAAVMQFAILAKEVPRAGWNKKFPKNHKFTTRKVKNAESVAAHMYGLAFLAMVVADTFKVNRLKLIEMALVHDLAESLAGDAVTSTEEGKKRRRLELAKSLKEAAAINTIANQGGKVGRRIKLLWLEFEAGKTPESKLLHQLDKLEMCFQAQRYNSKKQKFNPHEFIGTSKRSISEPQLRRLLMRLEKQCC